jgi:hypothetical protein
MTGGILKVPKGEMDLFYSVYVDTIAVNKLYLVEKITPRFKFFIDLDWTGDKPDLMSVIQRSNDVIHGRILAAVTPAKERDGVTKYGIHLHWPDLIVNRTEALKLRELLPNDIRIYADSSVYSTGLRMLWSHKKDGSLPYTPISSTSPDVRMLKEYSIRCDSSVEEPSQIEESTDDPLLEFVRKYMRGQSSVVFKKRKKYNQTITIESTSRFCERIGREHRSNHVCFVVDLDRKTVRQRCFDEDCKGYEGKKYILSQSVIDVLKGTAVSDDHCSFLAID